MGQRESLGGGNQTQSAQSIAAASSLCVPSPALLPAVGSGDTLPEGRGQAVGVGSRVASPVGIRSDSNTCTSSWLVPTPLFESRSDGKYLIVLPP